MQWKKVKYMQPVKFGIHAGVPFEDKFETQTGIKAKKYNQCKYA